MRDKKTKLVIIIVLKDIFIQETRICSVVYENVKCYVDCFSKTLDSKYTAL